METLEMKQCKYKLSVYNIIDRFLFGTRFMYKLEDPNDKSNHINAYCDNVIHLN